MKIPKEIKAFGSTYKVRIKKQSKDEGKIWTGQISHARQVIELGQYSSIKEKYSSAVIEQTFLHELIHLVCNRLNIPIKEHYVELLEVGLYHILKDNGLLK